jgi:hypothetical protein
MIKYIAKPNDWFKERTEFTLVDDFITGHKEENEVMMNEICQFSEFVEVII